MKEEEIIGGNKQIAEFMGKPTVNNICERCGTDVTIFPICQTDRYPRNHALGGRLIELKYHSSWDWLYPVINKIKKYWVDDNCPADKVCCMLIVSDIEEVYQAVLQFIHWYNNQLKR